MGCFDVITMAILYTNDRTMLWYSEIETSYSVLHTYINIYKFCNFLKVEYEVPVLPFIQHVFNILQYPFIVKFSRKSSKFSLVVGHVSQGGTAAVNVIKGG